MSRTQTRSCGGIQNLVSRRWKDFMEGHTSPGGSNGSLVLLMLPTNCSFISSSKLEIFGVEAKNDNNPWASEA